MDREGDRHMPKSFWLLIVGMTVNVTGATFLWPLNTIYIHGGLGKSLAMAGMVLMLNAGAAIIGNLIGGILFDSIGGYKTILSGILLSVTASGILAFYHGWIPYLCMLVLLGFGSGTVRPAMFALGGAVWPEGGRRAFNAIYVSQNLGVALGAAAGGWMASYSFGFVFAANAVMYAIFFIIAAVGFRRFDTSNESNPADGVIPALNGIRNRTRFSALLILCGGFFLCWLAYVQWQSNISAYTQEIGISLKDYSLLWTANGILIVLGQPVLSAFIKKLPSLKIQMAAGIVIFIASMLIAANSGSFTGFLAAMIVMTLGEMLVWPAVPTVANELAPRNRSGLYQGMVNSTSTAGKMVGPVLGGLVADTFGMSVLFTALMVVFGFAIVSALLFDIPLKRAKTEPKTEPKTASFS